MNLLPGFLVFGQTGLEECDILLDVEVVSSDRQQRFARMVYDDVGGLGIHAVCFGHEVGVYPAESFQYFAVRQRHPVFFRDILLIVAVERYHDEFVAEQLLYRRVRPYPLFHFAAVHAAVAGEVDEERFVGFDGGLHSLSVVVVAVDAVGQWREEIGVFLGIAGGGHRRGTGIGLAGGRAGIGTEHEVLRLDGRHISGESLERCTPHAG